jgi:hypothetical protein
MIYDSLSHGCPHVATWRERPCDNAGVLGGTAVRFLKAELAELAERPDLIVIGKLVQDNKLHPACCPRSLAKALPSVPSIPQHTPSS